MNQPTITPERLEILNTVTLQHGAHRSLEQGACAMELVSWLAGEPWSDHPECASPVIAAFVRAWNDSLPDEDRTRILAPYLPRLVGSVGTAEIEERRAYMGLDWLIRVQTPAWLRLAKLNDHALALEALSEIFDLKSAATAGPVVRAARQAAAAARDAARDAARAAARAAAGDAAGAAAWAAAGAAAWAAAWAALRPTVESLQESACQLLDRMLAVTEV